MENKLKPCPFCTKKSAYIQRVVSVYCVRCLFCGVKTRFCIDEEEAIAAWNRREK